MKRHRVKEYTFFEVIKGLKNGKKYLTQQNETTGYIYYDKQDKKIYFYNLEKKLPYTWYISSAAVSQKYTRYKKTNTVHYLAKNELLTKEEKRYLSTVIAPFKADIKCIKRTRTFEGPVLLVITYNLPDLDKYGGRCMYDLIFPASLTSSGENFKGLDMHKEYTLTELYLD